MKNAKDLVLKTENIKQKVEKDIKPFLDLIIKQPFVEGVVLLGGLGKRDFLDTHSDVDIAIFYESSTGSNHFLPFEFHATINGTKYEFNIYQVFYDKDILTEWDEGRKEAYSRAIVICDKKKRIKKLIRIKTLFNKKVGYFRLMYILQQFVWRGRIHSLRTFYRGYPEGSQDLLNACVELLIEGIYILNERPRPHRKWEIAMLTTMDLLPDNFFDILRESMLVLDYTEDDIKRRICSLEKIYGWVEKKAREKYPKFPEKPYEFYFKKFYQPKNECYIQKIARKMSINLDDDKRQELEGQLCLNLVSNKLQVDRFKSMNK